MELSERCIQTLEKEGFVGVYERKDDPDTVYPEHINQAKITIFVTEGSLELTIKGEKHRLRAGERYNIPPQTLHSVVVGPDGSQCVVGEMIVGDS